jgi:periplasmic protein TonB
MMKPKPVVDTSVLIEPIDLSLPPAAVKSGGGGGGGQKTPTPASKGVLPKADNKQLVPPTPIITNMAPELMAPMTVIIPELANIPRLVPLTGIGDPNGVVGPPSAGPGTGFGIGNGDGHGMGTGGGPYRVGGAGGASVPVCTYQPEPNYSDEARKAHIQGTVVLDSIIQKDGAIDVTKVAQKLGYGLDDEAIKILKKWKCNPGKVNGQPVAVQLQIVINFHLY